ncbi:hypothetical protein LTR94_038267, partial [Friedmanniomyces endolithicus]
MGFEDGAADVQAQAKAVGLGGEEGGEDLFQLLRRDARPLVADGDAYTLRDTARGQHDAAAMARL